MSTEKLADVMEHSMKSGYISMLILLALEKEPSNGYKLMKKISEETFGEWRPTNSTMYPYLSNLTNRGLIQYEKKKTGQRESKEYSLTTKGKKVLTMLVEKQQEMSLSLVRMISTVIDINTIPNNLLTFFSQSYHDKILIGKSVEEKIDIISRRLEIISFILSNDF